MPSLKDLRNRIASVKATRKITKAMQMVAAAKLRRAQEAGAWRRGPIPSAWRRCSAISPRRWKAAPTRRQLLAGTGRTRPICSSSRTAERGLCGGFNSSIAKLAREHADRLLAQGKTVKILCVGRKGNDALKRLYGRYIIDAVDFRGIKAMGFAHAQLVAQPRCSSSSRKAQFDVATLFFAEFKSVMSRSRRALQAHPGGSHRQRQGARARRRHLRRRARRRRDPRRASAAQHQCADFPGAARERRLRAGRAHERHGQRHPQRRRHDRRLSTLRYNRQRQAQITKELIEIISGAEAL